MSTNWMVEVKQEGTGSEAYLIYLRSADLQTGRVVDVIAPCRSVAEFTAAIQQLKADLDQFVEEARAKWEPMQGQGIEQRVPPAEAWQKMEASVSEEQMFEYFNSLVDADRQEIAAYVFSQVNMFKGRGPVFSEHYDAVSHMLE